MKKCNQSVCEKEIPENRTYCSRECQQIAFISSRKNKKLGSLSEEHRRKLSLAQRKSSTKEKRKQTCQIRYGGIAPSCSSEVQEKMKASYLEKYGVENPLQNDKVKKKQKQTFEDVYGGFTLSSKELSKKVKQTNLEKYGVENVFSSEEIKEKIKETNLERYGSENPMQCAEIQNKARETCIERYGVDNFLKLSGISYIFPEINDKEWWDKFTSVAEIKIYFHNLGVISDTSIYFYVRKFRSDLIGLKAISMPHLKVCQLLDSLGIEYETNTKQIIAPLELDVFIPSHNLAIEVNGLYWHSELAGKDRNYHLNKTLQCQARGIRLLQFWDSEINNQWPIISSMITNRLGLTPNRIGARECRVITPSREGTKRFLIENHIQGSCEFSYSVGLVYQDELVSCLVFSKSRYNKNVPYELLRFANRVGCSVVGGFSRLLKTFNKDCVTYADLRYSNGDLYESTGFCLSSINRPSYHYLTEIGLENRMKYQKHKLQNLLESYNPDETEWSNMVANGFDRVWDCGTKTYILRK